MPKQKRQRAKPNTLHNRPTNDNTLLSLLYGCYNYLGRYAKLLASTEDKTTGNITASTIERCRILELRLGIAQQITQLCTKPGIDLAQYIQAVERA
jgi:hypothetical protein